MFVDETEEFTDEEDRDEPPPVLAVLLSLGASGLTLATTAIVPRPPCRPIEADMLLLFILRLMFFIFMLALLRLVLLEPVAVVVLFNIDLLRLYF